MENAEKFLVVVLAAFLAIFLVLGIIAITKLIKLLDNLRRVSEKAEKLTENVATIGQYFKYTAGPAAVVKTLTNLGRTFYKRKRARSRKNDE